MVIERYSCPCCGASAERLSAAMLIALPIWSQSQKRILEAVKGRNVTDHEQLEFALWGGDPNGGPLASRRCLDVHLCNIRNKMKRHKLPWRLVNVWGGGVRLETMEMAL
jgi:hypothetical protein